MTLNHFLARAGLTSRRKAAELIREGRVTVNGQVQDNPAYRVASTDVVRADGDLIEQPESAYFILNKPKGYLTTLSDERRRPTVVQFFPPSVQGLVPIGRLDKDTSGLILLTNDGEFALRMAHPRYQVDKEYQVNCFGVPDDRDLARLERGITIEGKRTHPAQVNMVYASPEGHQATLRIVIHEGRKRQVRLMMEAIGHPVKDLSRVRIAHLTIKGMQPGECRRLPMKDEDRQKALVGLQPSDRVPVRETGRAPKKSS